MDVELKLILSAMIAGSCMTTAVFLLLHDRWAKKITTKAFSKGFKLGAAIREEIALNSQE